ncbi:hypothetical protein DXG01_005120 [Tephrocybe rancida]|nr:hypothetical protein DXG01_005120 [Tephrocybe rancida]
MSTHTLSSVSLFPATPEQTLESRCRTFVEWGKGLTLDEYLARDAFTDTTEVAQNGKLITWYAHTRYFPLNLRFRREGLVVSKSDPRPKKVACYGIASVFTSTRFRGKGYAGHMMRLLHWVIADASLLPAVFPDVWGAPPARVTHAGDGRFSVLWSDVGAEFYQRCGPTKDQDGWIVRDPVSTTWDVSQEGLSPEATNSDWTSLDEAGVSKLWEDDANNIASTLSVPDTFKASFSFLPHKGVAAFQHWRNMDVLQRHVSPRIQHWGIIANSDTFATWTFEVKSRPKTLLITRLKSCPEDFDKLFLKAMSTARIHGMEKIEVYNLPPNLQSASTRLGGVTVERKEHLSAFKWYGMQAPSEVAWVLNESNMILTSEVRKPRLATCTQTATMPPNSTKETPLTVRSKWLLYGILIPVGLFICSTLLRVQRTEVGVESVDFDHIHHYDDGATYTTLNVSAAPIPAFFLTAILPFTKTSLPGLEDALKSLLGPSQLREIILLSPYANALPARSVIRKVVSSYPDCPDIRLQTFSTDTNAQDRAIHAAARVSGWVLILGQDGLAGQTSHSRATLLQPPALSFPYGPNGICFSLFDTFEPCLRRSIGFPQEAHHLLPPFVMPAILATQLDISSPLAQPWRLLGERIAASRTDGIGGVVFGTSVDIESQAIGIERVLHHSSGVVSGLRDNGSDSEDYFSSSATKYPDSDIGIFVIILQTFEDLRRLSPLLCRLQGRGTHLVNVWVHEEQDNHHAHSGQFVASDHCALSYVAPSPRTSLKPQAQLHAWFQPLARLADVLLSLHENGDFTNLVADPTSLRHGSVSLRISRRDLPHTEWMGSLSLAEWKNWNQPRIDISIVTNNRPHSLGRLMTSLSKAYFYGDTVNLRMNVEQSADKETLKSVQHLHWPHGTMFVHHRIVQGGLMPAVVESWYPTSNDTYGLLLEDDVELSPLFYAWAKMSLLRYRYGAASNRSPMMFGISLYQQKNAELPLEGRRVFNARTLFDKHSLTDPTTPYLSPVPCSWGAIYFPEHWREFHGYLTMRLSSQFPSTAAHIVPNVRSNNWKKSWKKYFIELVYLRGYVMLYPNYPDFVSLSTNHLEVGSHVKVRTQEKQKQFIVPLMEETNCSSVGLLELPGQTLPSWDALPVLNLTGEMETLVSLAEMGRVRREELTGCTGNPTLFDIHQLVCIAPT